MRTWKSYAKSDLTGHTETDFQKCDLNWIPSHIRIARNGFAQIRFHEVRCRSDYLNMIAFQSDLHKNQIWVGSLNFCISIFFFIMLLIVHTAVVLIMYNCLEHEISSWEILHWNWLQMKKALLQSLQMASFWKHSLWKSYYSIITSLCLCSAKMHLTNPLFLDLFTSVQEVVLFTFFVCEVDFHTIFRVKVFLMVLLICPKPFSDIYQGFG